MNLLKQRQAIKALRQAKELSEQGNLIAAWAAIGISGELFNDTPISEVDGIVQVRVHNLMKQAGLIKGENK